MLIPEEDGVGETSTEQMALPVLRAAGGRNVHIGEPSHGSPVASVSLVSPTGDTLDVAVGPDDQFDPFTVFNNYSSAEPFDEDVGGILVRFSDLDPGVEFTASTAAFNCNGFGWVVSASTGDTTETRSFIVELIESLDCVQPNNQGGPMPLILRIVAGLVGALLLCASCGNGDDDLSANTTSASTTQVSNTTGSATPTTSESTTAVTSAVTSAPTSALTTGSEPTTASPHTPTTTTQATSELGQIAYWKGGELWLMDADGAGQRPLLTSVHLETGPKWSPDGTRLAFTGWDPDEPEAGSVFESWVLEADGSNLIKVTDTPFPHLTVSLAWSPDGARLLYATTEWDLWVIDVDGTDSRRITHDDARQNLPTWSPDGSLIAYCSTLVIDNLVTGREDIWVSGPDGGDPRQLTDTGKACEPAWSPDGTKIAFVNTVFPGHPADDYSDVWVMNADGSGQRNLTNDPTRFDQSPAWSPDGTQISFHSSGPFRVRGEPELEIISHDPPADIYVMPADGGPKTQLTTGDKSEAAPSWQP